MDVTTAVLAFVPLITLVQQTAKSLYRCAKTISVAKEKVSNLADEANLFASLLSNFHDTVVSAEQSDGSCMIRLDIKCCNAIVQQGNQSVDMMCQILVKLSPLRSGARYTRLQIFLAKWKWHSDREDFSTIIMTMNSVKVSASLLVNILHLKEILRMSQQHMVTGGNLPSPLLEKIKRYRWQIKSLKAQIATLEERCRAADTMAEASQRTNVELLKYAFRLQREHARQDPMLEFALRSRTNELGTNEFAARLRNLANVSNSPSSHISTTPATVPVAQTPVQARSLRRPLSTLRSRTSMGASSSSGTRSTSQREPSDDEWPAPRNRPTNGVPTALFRDDDRLPPAAPEGAGPADQSGPQHIIVDRNDGSGVQEEFRRPRRHDHHY